LQFELGALQDEIGAMFEGFSRSEDMNSMFALQEDWDVEEDALMSLQMQPEASLPKNDEVVDEASLLCEVGLNFLNYVRPIGLATPTNLSFEFPEEHLTYPTSFLRCPATPRSTSILRDVYHGTN
jgi:hypothetical protein